MVTTDDYSLDQEPDVTRPRTHICNAFRRNPRIFYVFCEWSDTAAVARSIDFNFLFSISFLFVRRRVMLWKSPRENFSYEYFTYGASDSLSCLQVLSSPHSFDVSITPFILIIKSLFRDLLLYKEFVQFLWVPSHVRIKGNETADRLAYSTKSYILFSYFKLPHSDLLPIFRKLFLENLAIKMVLSSTKLCLLA